MRTTLPGTVSCSDVLYCVSARQLCLDIYGHCPKAEDQLATPWLLCQLGGAVRVSWGSCVVSIQPRNTRVGVVLYVGSSDRLVETCGLATTTMTESDRPYTSSSYLAPSKLIQSYRVVVALKVETTTLIGLIDSVSTVAEKHHNAF